MIKFAFYGRVSTEDQQDPESSRGWQLTRRRNESTSTSNGPASSCLGTGECRRGLTAVLRSPAVSGTETVSGKYLLRG
jgi:hypothetical protein